MKPLFLFCTLLFTLTSTAQWSTDPAAPLVVCNAPGTQTVLRAMADGNGGWYAFWIDDRLDGMNAEIYGQHLDADGYAQWTGNGKLLLSAPSEDIKELAPVLLDNGNVLITYIFGPSVFLNSLWAMAFDPAGEPVWASPTVIDSVGTTLLGLDQVTAIPADGGAHVGWYDNFFGGSNLLNVSRINNNGTLPWGAGGHDIQNAYYGPFELHDDGADGVMVQWRTGNGTGAALFAMRVDANGANAWPVNVQTSANNTGLNYAFHTVEMGGGTQITSWRDVPGNIVMAGLNNTGALTFPSTPLPICTYASYHDQPKLAESAGALFAAWADNRPPANTGAVYLQKFDANGAPLWTVDGLAALQINTSFVTTGMVSSDSGAVIVMMDGNVDGYAAMRIREDGTQDWSTTGQFCTTPFNPFYAERKEMPDGNGGVVSFWRTVTGDLYGARIYRNGELGNHVGIGERLDQVSLRLFPNPANDRITTSTSQSERILEIRVFGMDGRLLLSRSTNGTGPVTMDISTLRTGSYLMEALTEGGTMNVRFIKD